MGFIRRIEGMGNRSEQAGSQPGNNRPPATPAEDPESQEAKGLDLDDVSEADKAVSGFSGTFATLFMGSLGMLFMLQPEALHQQDGYPSFLLHASSVSLVCLTMCLATVLLCYMLAYPGPSGQATLTKIRIMYIGLFWLVLAGFTRVFAVLPSSYRNAVILEIICGAIASALFIVYPMQRFQKTHTTTNKLERSKGIEEELIQTKTAIALLNEVAGIERCSDKWLFAVSLFREHKNRLLFMAISDSSHRRAWIEYLYNRLRDTGCESPIAMFEDPFSISMFINALQKYKAKFSTAEMMKAIEVAALDPSTRELFLALPGDLQENWISVKVKGSNF